MQSPDYQAPMPIEPAEPVAIQNGPVAPMWHTVALILFILAISFAGVYRHRGAPGSGAGNRLGTYAVTALLELALAGWVVFGLRLRKVPLRSIFGNVSHRPKAVAVDLLIAFAFWIVSLMALASVAMFWVTVEMAITHRGLPIPGQPVAPDPAQQKAIHAVLQLAPGNGKEIVGWIVLCALVGFVEELVFRGYLQRQFTAFAGGAAVAGVIFSAVVFGAAHGYEGARSMFLLAIFGAFFSLLAIFRRNLRAGMFAHSWHDLVAGLTLAFLHARHIV